MKSLLSLLSESLLKKVESILGTGLQFHAVAGLVLFLLILLLGKLTKLVLDTVGRRIIAKTETDLDDKILELVVERIMAISAVSGMYLGMQELS